MSVRLVLLALALPMSAGAQTAAPPPLVLPPSALPPSALLRPALPDASDGTFRSRYLAWDASGAAASVTLLLPTLRPLDRVQLSSNFGPRFAPMAGASSFHEGVDIPSPTGTPVRAVADGTVVRAGWAGGYGNLVEIDHGGGMRTRYGHLSNIFAGLLTPVRRGETIGAVGSTGRSTGSHLHYEVRIDGRAVDPGPWLDGVVTMSRTFTPYDDRPTISSFAKARGEAVGSGLTR